MSSSVLFTLVDDLERHHLLHSEEKMWFLSWEQDIRSKVFYLVHLVHMKSPEESKKMEYYLRHIEPRLYEHCFVDQYKNTLIDMVGNVDMIIKDLKVKGIATSDDINAIQNPHEKMSKVIDSLKSLEQKLIFCSILQGREPQILRTIWMKMDSDTPWMDEDKNKHFEMVTVKWFKENATVAKEKWTKCEPEETYDDDGNAWYRFMCVPGKYECSVSGLRWTCKDSPLRFKYCFGKWWELKDKVYSLRYMPAGPLLDITVTEGEFDEVYLPHWICTTVDPTILDKFAVLHSGADGVTVEKVSEVTPSHVKLLHSLFSPRGVLLWIWHWVGFPVSLECKVLIYRTKKTFLTLHVYVIPNDPALEADLNRKAGKKGYENIEKPYPEGTLKTDEQLQLNTDVNGAEIMPNKYRFRYESRDPNYFEVFIKEPGDQFTLQLEQCGAGPVWSCAIRQFDYSSAVPEVRTYDDELLRVRSDFAERVSEEVINQLLDDLLGAALNDGEKDAIIEKNKTLRNTARALIDTVRKKGPEASKTMIRRLEHRDPTLHNHLGLPSLPTPVGR